MKLAFVVQRYGLDINGGAELHCRWIAELMKRHFDVEVLTTKAHDYISWRDYYDQDEETINGILIRRFPVTRSRNPIRFGRIQDYILNNKHREEDEMRWLNEEGPMSPALIQYIKKNEHVYDYFIFFSYRYYHSYWGINLVPDKSILVPTAEEDPVVNLNIFKKLFKKPRAFIYNSLEEKMMINAVSQNEHILGDIVGVGTKIPSYFSGTEFCEKYGIENDYLVYIGRIDENKGCDELFRYFLLFKKEIDSDIKLVLIGNTKINIPSSSDIIYLGFLSEEDKFSALDGSSILMMPSYYESLSMVALEAWALKKPVLANARCRVLKGQCIRSNGGLYYEHYAEFREALNLLVFNPEFCKAMGENGRKYFENNYTWNIIEKKYLSVIEQLEKEK